MTVGVKELEEFAGRICQKTEIAKILNQIFENLDSCGRQNVLPN